MTQQLLLVKNKLFRVEDMKNILFFLLLSFSAISGFGNINQIDMSQILQDGDLIFHKSQSAQSYAIREATASEWSHVGIIVKKDNSWFVAEARNGVEATPLKQFIARGKNQEFKIFRFKAYRNAEMRMGLYQALAKYFGKTYDIYFEFNNDRIYCSELTYKVMKEVTGAEIGIVNKMKDLRLDGPHVQELIKRRLTDLGKVLNPEEPIVTPISQMLDTNLEMVFNSY